MPGILGTSDCDCFEFSVFGPGLALSVLLGDLEP